MCHNNIDNSVYDGRFQSKFGLAFRCPECMPLIMKTEDSKVSCNICFSNIKTIIDTLEYVLFET